MRQDQHQPVPMPIAVDTAYRVRDNQFWYSDCTFARTIREKKAIKLRIEGLGERTLAHARAGRDHRPTLSYTLPSAADRQWWKQQCGRITRVELLGVTEWDQTEAPASLPSIPGSTESPTVQPGIQGEERPLLREATLCIGLDIAWFGGSATRRDSQYDCIGSVLIGREVSRPRLTLTRVPLDRRDPDASLTLAAITTLLAQHKNVGQVVFALDAPIQALERGLPERASQPAAGSIRRRACESFLSRQRQIIDAQAQGGNGWHPNIQPGAPLAPRVQALLNGLRELDFVLWTPGDHDARTLVIECFPSEAIWAAKRLGNYREDITAACARAYKRQGRTHLMADQVQRLVHDVLDGFARPSGDARLWNIFVNAALRWMLDDETWQANGLYRCGKLLDDVVDTMICLATSLSYAHGCAHVWRDPQHPSDGHIIGPGFSSDGFSASPRE